MLVTESKITQYQSRLPRRMTQRQSLCRHTLHRQAQSHHLQVYGTKSNKPTAVSTVAMQATFLAPLSGSYVQILHPGAACDTAGHLIHPTSAKPLRDMLNLQPACREACTDAEHACGHLGVPTM
jgi:hypothetical protein